MYQGNAGSYLSSSYDFDTSSTIFIVPSVFLDQIQIRTIVEF